MNNAAICNPQHSIRVLVVDDSAFMRAAIRQILGTEKAIEVADVAGDGEEALEKVKRVRPDVVILDIEMPGMDGLSALVRIMAECPTPVLMLSALNRKDATVAIKSLELGAVDFITKPSGPISYDIERLSKEIVSKVKIASQANIVRQFPGPAAKPSWPQAAARARKSIVVIGASTGGPGAVAAVLGGLGRDISASVIVVQHMGSDFIPYFARMLKWKTPMDVFVAQKGEEMRPGRALVAPGGCHLIINGARSSGKVRLSRKISPSGVVPCIDFAMESAANVYGGETLGVLLTGMGSDGAKGMKAIKDAGGATIAEDRSSTIVFSMPKAAIDLGCVDEVLPLDEIAAAIMRHV